MNTLICHLPHTGRTVFARAFAGMAKGHELTKPSVMRAGAHPQWAYGSEDDSPPGRESV
ncbi:MAG: hypothetical protein AB7P37_04150 [Ramlibacter sp.]